MIKPPELASDAPFGSWSCRGCDVWDAICAAVAGDAEALRRLLGRDPNLYRAGYWYTPPIHFAVREGHLEAVRVLLEAGADPAAVALSGESLITVARDRGHEAVARLLEEVRAERGRTAPDLAGADHAIHLAAAAGDVAQVEKLLDADPQLVHRGDGQGGTPLHRAVGASAREVIELLLDRGADIHARHGAGGPNAAGYAPVDFQPIDLTLWGRRPDRETARLLLSRGADGDTVIAAALGDRERVTALLAQDPARIEEARPCGRRALSAAVEFGHEGIARLLLDRGADPNGSIESSGSATYAAKTRELRALLMARGGRLDAYDLIFLDEDDEAVRRVAADPRSADEGCGGALAAACTLGKLGLLVRLLDAGARVPPVLTPCRSYLLSDPAMLRLLLASGMNPDLPNWQRATPLHDLCGRDSRGRSQPLRKDCAVILLDAGATISARDEDYRSTPLAWAARNDLPEMVELLLARGAPTNLPDDEPWATPLAWATKRGHGRIAEMLRRAGATA